MCSSTETTVPSAQELSHRLAELTAVLSERSAHDRRLLADVKTQAIAASQAVEGEAFTSLFKGLLLAIDRLNTEECTQELVVSVVEEILDVCSEHGLKGIEEIDRFNPRIHEAVGVVEVDEPSMHGAIVTIERTGYLLGEKVLRPARVIVAKYSPSRHEGS